MLKMNSQRIQHVMNPLHLYCRLVDFGMSVNFSKKLGITYEKYFHRYFLKKDKALWNSIIRKYW